MARKQPLIRSFAAATLTLGLALGCSAEKQTASLDTQPIGEPLAVNLAGEGGHALGAGDALGVATFEQADDTSRLALFRTADKAFAVAEAKEAAGEYDAWFAAATGGPVQPDGSAIAEADQSDDADEQAGEDSDDPSDVFVTVPIPEE